MKFFKAVTLGLMLLCILIALRPIWNWAIVNAVFLGTSPEACAKAIEAPSGACWPVVWDTMRLLLFGRYPQEILWRPGLAAFLPVVVAIILACSAALRCYFSLVICALCGVNYFLMAGIDSFGISPVSYNLWGGFSLTVCLTLFAATLALPIGICLALMRQSQSTIIFSRFAACYVEIVRGIPMITVLFMAQFLFPIVFGFVGMSPFVRIVVAIALFQAAYVCEAVRGGLIAVGAGQQQAAASLGMNYTTTVSKIMLPQALTVAMPPLVGTVIGLFKDSSLVSIVGLFDLLGMARNVPTMQKWIGFDIEPLLFAWFVYFVVSLLLEKFSGTIFKSQKSLA